jgi:hypothetical protein
MKGTDGCCYWNSFIQVMTYVVQIPIPIFLKLLIENLNFGDSSSSEDSKAILYAGIISVLVTLRVIIEMYGLHNGSRAYVQPGLLTRMLIVKNVMSLPPGALKHVNIGSINTMIGFDTENFQMSAFLLGHGIVRFQLFPQLLLLLKSSDSKIGSPTCDCLLLHHPLH